MLEHVLKGDTETAVLTHRATGARADVTVTLAGPPPWAAFSVTAAYGPEFAVTRDGDWYRFDRGADRASVRAAYVQRTRHEGRPSFQIDAPYAAFSVRFLSDRPPPGRLVHRRPRRA